MIITMPQERMETPPVERNGNTPARSPVTEDSGDNAEPDAGLPAALCQLSTVVEVTTTSSATDRQQQDQTEESSSTSAAVQVNTSFSHSAFWHLSVI